MNKLILRLFGIICVFCIAFSNVTYAENSNCLNKADALNYLGLFQGTDNGYELEKSLTRAEAITMVVRFLGAENEAKQKKYEIPFTDVPEWATDYVGYAFEKGITQGTGDSEFSPNLSIEMNQYLTFLLRVLGYNDSEGDFKWDVPYELATKAGILNKPIDTSNPFVRGDMVDISYDALTAKYKDGSMSIFEYLVGKNCFTSAGFQTAQSIAKSGKEEALKNNPSSSGVATSGGGGKKYSSTGTTGENTSNNDSEKYENITYKVTFYNDDGSILDEQGLKRGENAYPPIVPEKNGFVFAGWSHPFSNIMGDTQTYAKFVSNDSPNLFIVSCENSSVKKGETFDVSVDLTGVVNFCSCDMRIKYDSDLFEIIDFEANPLMDIYAENFIESGEVRFNIVKTNNITDKFHLMKFKVIVKDSKARSSVIKLEAKDIVRIGDAPNYDVVDCEYTVADCVVRID